MDAQMNDSVVGIVAVQTDDGLFEAAEYFNTKQPEKGLQRLVRALAQGAKYNAVEVVIQNAMTNHQLPSGFEIPPEAEDFKELYRIDGRGYDSLRKV